ncbi:tRNA processing endoribonuclease Trz1 [Ophiocordyceps camponoti-floridani]|uniref:ribonuclease Z n=1 Tax=Ophiocordyceps camponoti-floridani TaxID=2030778 RepID=A0A8H4VAI3_9HYPO|nr:tRNA processing endoribonuclease Trz1 [Ophiocordyceps camponoti-floridani]
MKQWRRLHRHLPNRSVRHTSTLPQRVSRDTTVMSSTVQLAVVPSADTPGTTIYFHHEKRSYVFGRVAEGTQRALSSRKIHFGGTEHVFLSGVVGWESMGGLLGFVLSVAAAASEGHEGGDDGKKQEKKAKKMTERAGLVIHGGENLSHVLAACRPVILHQQFRVRISEHRDDTRGSNPSLTEADWQDENISVWKLPIRREQCPSRKRTHQGIEATEARQPKASDASPAKMLVEGLMFNGAKAPTSLIARKLSDVDAARDPIFVDDDSVLRRPRPEDPPDKTAWLLAAPSPKDVPDAYPSV